MPKNQSDLPEHIYHRMYRLIQRRVEPRLIAAALQVTLRTVQNVIARFEAVQGSAYLKCGDGHAAENGRFLDLYTYHKTRCSILHLVGSVLESQKDALSAELDKIAASSINVIALRMSDVSALDHIGAKIILQFYDQFSSHGRFAAILDPSPLVEASLVEFGIDTKIPIYGTERAFEDAAASSKNSSAQWKSRP